MHKYFRQVVLIVIWVAISACGSETKPVKSIVTIGDSIGNGFGMATPWPDLIRDQLGIPLSNTSVSGMETGWGVEVVGELLDTHKPSHLLLLLGTNDATRGPSIPKAIKNFQTITDVANSKNVTILIGTVIPNTRSADAEQRAVVINQGIRKLNNAIIVDTRAAMGSGMGLLADGVHPNDAGQKVIADAFLAMLTTISQ